MSTPVGELLRDWRGRRRLSQLDLSLRADISARHLSFVETGRSAPSRDMVLRLAEQLEVPLRERNRLLLAAGFAPAYRESALDSPRLSAVQAAVRQVLAAHEPYPSVAVDRRWNLVEANAASSLFTDDIAPHLLAGQPNALRISLHPDGMASRIVNLGQWRAHLLGRLAREVAVSGDAEVASLLAELRDYPCDEPEVEVPDTGEVFVPLRVRHAGAELSLLSTVSTFGTALDITVAELSVESFFPADAATASFLRARLT
ncbi:helix-turn-helix transcriptional regulator [Allokutzneria sp. A3M-2-11 16]|uniref:helix-turn-helix domain-containing protein n=1 Tax=Allokutzneria sp. A3M-2-11 16 TaxID=2962043 RepID=UPI0020B66578|nr:helix-turn-helix transcriptional regulator [Allokutzneria sp. A3M-2-11 16]MCP3802851.1 helix-turn-helix transcriptional regulator [Allokutzneria sp. A3M-2-11 16]